MDTRIGAAEVNITPATGLPMDGYLARERPNEGVHDPLFAQVLVLEHGQQRFVLVTLDVLAVSASVTVNMRQSIADAAATQSDAVMICASHTHAGPAGLQDWFPISAAPRTNPELVDAIQSRIVQATRLALDRLGPATLSYAASPIEHIGMDRNRPLPAPDNQVTVLRFDRSDGFDKFDKPDRSSAAIIFHYACHPTVLGPQLLYSADFPGAARDRIKRTYPDTACMFINGAAGNISTRFTRHAQTFEEVQRIGDLLGEHVLELCQQHQPAPWKLASSSVALDLPLRTFAATARDISPSGNQRIDQTRAEGAQLEAMLARAFAGQILKRATLHVVQIGPWRLFGVPGEPFNELTANLRRVSPWALVVGYANDYVGYFPTQQAVDDATYEALSSPYDARALALIGTTLLGVISR